MTERMDDKGFQFLIDSHTLDPLSLCGAGWLIAERAKVRELEVEVTRLQRGCVESALKDGIIAELNDFVTEVPQFVRRAEAAEAKVASAEVKGRIDMRDEIIAKLKDFEAVKCAQIAASVPSHAGETE